MSTEGEFQNACQKLWERSSPCHVGAFVEQMLRLGDEDLQEDIAEALRVAVSAAAEAAHPEENFEDSDGDLDEDAREAALERFRDEDSREPMEYYSVDGWLADRLLGKNEAVFEFAQHSIWIRCATGQAPSMDNSIREITREHAAD